MTQYVRSSDAIVKPAADGHFLVSNGITTEFLVPAQIARLLELFNTPRHIEELKSSLHDQPAAESIDRLLEAMILIPLKRDDVQDMRSTWDCLAHDSDQQAGYFIDNESKGAADFDIFAKNQSMPF